MLESLLPTIREVTNQPVDTQYKDGDPRKTAFAVGLMTSHQVAMAIYQDFGLMVKVPIADETVAQKEAVWGHSVRIRGEGWEKRKHFASEHMVTVIAGTQALGQLLHERSHLSSDQVVETERAAAIHDAGKELEFVLVNTALRDQNDINEYATVLASPNIKVVDRQSFLARIIEASPQLQADTPKGKRAQVAYDLAGDINELRLKEKRVRPDLLKIQKMVGHTSCPETEEIVDSFDTLKDADRQRAIQILVMHYIDDVVTNPNIIDPAITEANGERLNALDRRCIQNENNSKYTEYDQAWQQDPRNKTGETAFVMQRRVGHKVEKVLADLLGINDPLTMPEVIDSRIRSNIENNWNKLQQPKSDL